jgi:type IV pilus assembly protein PilW
MARGFSWVSLLISLLLCALLGLAICHALLTLHRGMRLVMQQQSMAQTAVALHSLLQQQLVLSQFLAGQSSVSLQRPASLQISGDCVSTGGGGSFPKANSPWSALWLGTVGQTPLPTCLSQPIVKSDVLQLKRFGGEFFASAARDNRQFFWQTASSSGWEGEREPMDSARYWPFIHEVYYLTKQSGVPVLMRKRLIKQGNYSFSMDTSSIIEGVEMLVFEVGIDQDQDGQIDAFVKPAAVPIAVWQQQQGVVRQLRYFAVIRSRIADPTYTNDQLYRLGTRQFQAPGDHFRRLQVQSSVSLLNPPGRVFE